MRRLGRFALQLGLPLFVLAGAGCALVADLGDRSLGDITSGDASRPDGSSGGIDSGGVDGNGGGQDGQGPVGASGFSYHRAINLSSDATTALVNHATLVVLPSSFPYAHAKPNGEDIRFSVSPNHADDLTYFIEKWTPAAESLVWIKVANVPTGTSTIHMFYGQATATDQSSFTTTFPNAQRTQGAGAGNLTSTGDINVDWFELKAGDTLTLASAVPLTINARRIIIAGTIDGVGRGFAGGALVNGTGSGPGGGVASIGSVAGAGGGGHGGAGGAGGADGNEAGGVAGAANGNATDNTIAMGSGGGTSENRLGGAGGGAVSLFGWKTTVTGTIRMDGANGAGLNPHGGGGGAGGGILVGASFLELAGGTLTANGGSGGPCAEAANDGGGGGGGGRIKLRRRASGNFTLAALMTAALGAGGGGAGTNAPGQSGLVGTTHSDDASTLLKGVESTLGNEDAAP